VGRVGERLGSAVLTLFRDEESFATDSDSLGDLVGVGGHVLRVPPLVKRGLDGGVCALEAGELYAVGQGVDDNGGPVLTPAGVEMLEDGAELRVRVDERVVTVVEAPERLVPLLLGLQRLIGTGNVC
jgi:hypothetical protein